jgi:deoxyribodipyrimidine photo-lyase
MVSPLRVRRCNQRAVNPDGGHVLYWMVAARRTRYNAALERAAEHARSLGKPLLVLEALRSDYPWASDRLHAFVLAGMADNARDFVARGVSYLPYVEPVTGAGHGLLEALAERAALVVTDDFPGFFLPRMVAAAAQRVPVSLEAVDSNGLLPLLASDVALPTAYAFRRFLQTVLPAHIEEQPVDEPLALLHGLPAAAIPPEVLLRWPPAASALLEGDPSALARLPIDHSVSVVTAKSGGSDAALRALHRFVDERLAGYTEHRNDLDRDWTSGLSPYLHFGHMSTHEVLAAVAGHESWSTERLASTRSGKRSGWWGMSEGAEAFLDQLVTWRELGYKMAHARPDSDSYESLPMWARATLERHQGDSRQWRYTFEQLADAATHDPLWNAAQRQLRREGRIHNYLRMLWGKKILEWSETPRRALAVMLELNNRCALDGRDPNSTSGICWCLGRYDRPWGPERPIFGTVRYMSSDSTARKLRVGGYLETYRE